MRFCIFLIAAALAVFPARAQIDQARADSETFAEDLKSGSVDTSVDAMVDPWEGFNRRMFRIHLFVDRTVLVPAARGYRAVTHEKQRKGIRNLLANARAPFVFFNDILQGEFGRAGTTAGRFFVNSTIGFAGMGDPAGRLGMTGHREDFGQTFAVWGIDSGPYMIVPGIGPTTIRDGFGAGLGVVADPLIWLRGNPAQIARLSRIGVTGVSAREPFIEPLADIEANSLDYYASLRSFYLQSRKREINNGRTDFDDLPDIGDFEEFDDLE